MGNIWVTGANGQLGQELQELASGQDNWYFTDLPELDICNQEACQGFIEAHQIQTIIHCAAYTAVDRAESDPETTFRTNTQASLQLADLARKADAQLIFISTDYVFDGNSPTPYRESDPCTPISVYGRSKREAEIGIQQSGAKGIIIRTAWLYSTYGSNFVKTMLRLSEERSEIQVVNDQLGSPTYAKDLAAAIRHILPQLDKHDFHGEIFHYTNEGCCSWHDLAVLSLQLGKKDCIIRPIPTTAYPTAAHRPAYSLLSKEKIRTVFGVETPDWKASLAKFFEELLP